MEVPIFDEPFAGAEADGTDAFGRAEPFTVGTDGPAGAATPATATGADWAGGRWARWSGETWVGAAGWLGRQARSARFPQDATIPVVRAGSSAYRLALRWAAGRGIAPNSVTGLSLLFGLCAATWLSGGSAQDTHLGTAALAAWLGTRFCAARFAADAAQRPDGDVVRPSSRLSRKALGRRRTLSRRNGLSERKGSGATGSAPGSDWLVLPFFDWAATSSQATARGASREAADTARAGHRSFEWLAAICGVAAEYAVYGGIAAGAVASGWPGTWQLAAATVIVLALAQIGGSCWRVAVAGAQSGGWNLVLAMLASPSARILVAATGLIIAGPRVALFAVLAIGLLALSVAAVGGQHARPQVIVACRDDGPLARWAGRLVQGNLPPLPPVLAGLIAIAVLAALGLANLPGFIALAPIVVLLLAAPGSSHPHGGRFDWLIPGLLCLAQYGYLVAFGVAHSVAWPVIFAVCALTALGYAAITAAQVSRPDSLGWDGRICAAGVAGMFGIATFGYLGLAVCLGALIARRVVIGYLIPPGEHQ